LKEQYWSFLYQKFDIHGDFFHVDCVKILDENQLTETLPSHEPLCSLLFDSVYGAFLHRVWDFPD